MHVYILLFSVALVYLVSSTPIYTRNLRGTFGTCIARMDEALYMINAYIEPLAYANLRGGQSTYMHPSIDDHLRNPSIRKNQSASVIHVVKTSFHSI